MLSKERFLYIALLLLSSVFISYLFFSEDESYVEQYNFEIKKLEQKIDSLHNINHELTYKVDTLQIQIKELDLELGLKDNRIKSLKYEINTKMDAVDSFNVSELEKFFTDRYRQYNDSIKKTNSPISN